MSATVTTVITVTLPEPLAARLDAAVAGLGWDRDALVIAALARFLALPDAIQQTDPVHVAARLIAAGVIRLPDDPRDVRPVPKRRKSPCVSTFVCIDCGEAFEEAATNAKRCRGCRDAHRRKLWDARNARWREEHRAVRTLRLVGE